MKSLSEISIAKWMEIIIRGDLFCMDGKCRIPLWKTQNCKTIFLSVWWILYSSSMHILLPFLRCIFSPTLKCNIMRQAYLEKKVKCYYRIKSAELTGYSLYSFIHRYTEMLPLSNRTSWCLTMEKLFSLTFARHESGLMSGLHKRRCTFKDL